MKSKIEKSYFKIIIKLLVMMIFIVSLSTVNNVYAAERKTVRVAFFPMDGYHIVEEDGS